VRLGDTIERARIHAVGALALQRGLQPLLDTLAADARHGRGVDLQRAGDGGIAPARSPFSLVGFEQDAGARQHPGGRLPPPDERA